MLFTLINIMALPFYVTVERKDEKVYRTVDDVLNYFEQIGEIHIPRRYLGSGPWKDGEFGSIPWYVSKAYNRERRQVDLQQFWDLLKAELWQKGDRHYELVMEGYKFLIRSDKTQNMVRWDCTRRLCWQDTKHNRYSHLHK